MTVLSALAPRLEAAADGPGTITFLGSAAGTDGPQQTISWAELHDDARAMAAALQVAGRRAGLARGDPRVRRRGRWSPRSRRRGCAARRPSCSRSRCGSRSIDEFVEQTRARIRASDAIARRRSTRSWPSSSNRLREIRPSCCSTTLAADGRSPDAFARPADDPEALAILQYTSGSTSDPTGVILPHRCVTSNLDAIVTAARLEAGVDRGVSWLPLYHDMGLIGLLTIPMTTGMDLALGRAPGLPRRARAVDAVVRRVRRNGERGPELRVRARGARVAPHRPDRSLGVAVRAQRRGAHRPRRGRAFRRSRGPSRSLGVGGVPRVRDGGGDTGRHVPGTGFRTHGGRRSTGGCSRTSSTRRRSHASTRTARRLAASAVRVPGLSVRSVRTGDGPGDARPRSRRGRDHAVRR